MGAGPGDPELITLKGWRILREADTVIHDRLVSGEILRHAREGANLIEVGKRPGGPSFDQEEICRLLAERASAGEMVLRLKNGDPFVFGRGSEEALYLAERGVDFEVIPGLSSATAVPSSAGIPLTHRGLSRSVAIITGHTMEATGTPQHDWKGIVSGFDTLVILMGHGNLAWIVEKLLDAGMRPRKPAAAISWGTTSMEKVVLSPLADLPRALEQEKAGPPLILVIGETVGLGDRIRPCLSNKALSGKRVLIMRDEGSENGLARQLAANGARVLHVPAIRVEENPSAKVVAAFERGEGYDWVVFTSRNAVDLLFRHLERAGFDARVFFGSRLCAIGPGTAHALGRHHLRADAVPKTYSTRGLLSMLRKSGLAGEKILLVRSSLADHRLKKSLEKAGAMVEETHPYRVQVAEGEDPRLIEEFARGDVDVVLLTSPSTVAGLLNLIGGKRELLDGVTVGCIGPITAKSAQAAGIQVSFRAARYCDDGLIQALIDHLGR